MRRSLEHAVWDSKSTLRDMLLLPLLVLSFLFRFGTAARRWLYLRGVLNAYTPSCPCISVGNLTVGGTGKTPMVIHLCTLLKGKKIAVVARGYASVGSGIRMVSDGRSVLMGPDVCGDEPYLIASTVPGAIVAVGEKKSDVVRFVEQHYHPEVIVLDDGFSHLRVARDIDLVLIDGDKGFGNGHLLPAGPLREPPAALRFADVIGIKGREDTTIETLLRRHAGKTGTFHFTYRVRAVKSLDSDQPVPAEQLRNKTIVALAGIAFPDSFFKLLGSLGIQPAHCVAKTDHHTYDEHELASLTRRYAPDAVIITAKDAVKMKGLRRASAVAWLYVDIAVEEDSGVLSGLLRSKGLLP